MATSTRRVVLEPAAQAVADANGKPPFLFELGPEEGRKVLDQVQGGDVYAPYAVAVDLVVPGGPNTEVPVRIMRPEGDRELPVVLYIHGAGWVFGDKSTHDRLIRELAVGVDAAVVFPDYHRSPEVRYPS